MISNNVTSQLNTIENGCSFYFASRRNKCKWECFFIHPFLLDLSDGVITGQFVSTIWFNEQVNKGDEFDFIVLRLPRRDHVFHHDEIKTKEMIIGDILTAERNQTPINDLEYVVIHKRYTRNEIENILEIVTTKIAHDNRMENVKHQENVNFSDNKRFGLSFVAVRNTIVSLDTKRKTRTICTKTTSESHLNQKTTYPSKLVRRNTSDGNYIHHANNTSVYVCCPTFEIKYIDKQVM